MNRISQIGKSALKGFGAIAATPFKMAGRTISSLGSAAKSEIFEKTGIAPVTSFFRSVSSEIGETYSNIFGKGSAPDRTRTNIVTKSPSPPKSEMDFLSLFESIQIQSQKIDSLFQLFSEFNNNFLRNTSEQLKLSQKQNEILKKLNDSVGQFAKLRLRKMRMSRLDRPIKPTISDIQESRIKRVREKQGIFGALSGLGGVLKPSIGLMGGLLTGIAGSLGLTKLIGNVKQFFQKSPGQPKPGRSTKPPERRFSGRKFSSRNFFNKAIRFLPKIAMRFGPLAGISTVYEIANLARPFALRFAEGQREERNKKLEILKGSINEIVGNQNLDKKDKVNIIVATLQRENLDFSQSKNLLDSINLREDVKKEILEKMRITSPPLPSLGTLDFSGSENDSALSGNSGADRISNNSTMNSSNIQEFSNNKNEGNVYNIFNVKQGDVSSVTTGGGLNSQKSKPNTYGKLSPTKTSTRGSFFHNAARIA